MNILQEAAMKRSISQKERDALPDSDFAGPHESFPIRNQHDVDSAAKLIGHADDPDAVKRKIIEIAKRKGLSLPESWQSQEEEDKGKEGKMDEDVERSVTLPSDFSFYVPFTRVSPDDERREIVGIATKEVLDSHGTIISYEASKKAFARWVGNIREQHDPKKAVGKAIEWTPDDENRQIIVRAFISKGATDTWEKIKDGTLTGFSISGVDAKYKMIQRDGKSIPFIDEYDMPELSIVDNPSCPVGPVALVRVNEASDVLASDEEIAEVLKIDEQPVLAKETPTEDTSGTFERAGKTISANTSSALHDATTSALASAVKMMQTCGCPSCQKAAAILDPDNDGDIDFMSIDDTDGDAAKLGEQVERMVSNAMAPVYARMQSFLGEFSRRQSDTTHITERLASIERTLATLDTLQKLEKLDEVLGVMGQVKGQVERIAGTPMPGGPHTGKRTPQELPSEHDAIISILERDNVPLTAQQRQALVARTMRPVTVPLR